jgi:hypothetical protein
MVLIVVCQYLEKRTDFHCIYICDYMKAILEVLWVFLCSRIYSQGVLVILANSSQRVKEGLKGVWGLFSHNTLESCGPIEHCWKSNGCVVRMVIFCLVVGLRVCQCARKAVCVVFVWSLTFVAVTSVMWERTVASHASVTTMQTVLVQTNSISVWNVTTTPRLESFHCNSLSAHSLIYKQETNTDWRTIKSC